MGKLAGKITPVTGGNSGIGLAATKRFVDKGAHVFITGRRKTELTVAVTEIGNDVTGVKGDVAVAGDLDRHFAQIEQEHGRLDEITEELYHAIFDVNVKGPPFTVQKVLPLLPDCASIILNASIVGSKGLAPNSVYSATKATVRSFARTWTTDLKRRRIRVNAVSSDRPTRPGSLNCWRPRRSAPSAGLSSPARSRSPASARQTKSRRRWCSSPPMTAAMSPERSSSSIVVSRRFRRRQVGDSSSL